VDGVEAPVHLRQELVDQAIHGRFLPGEETKEIPNLRERAGLVSKRPE
jgi:hypothetical protein